MKLNQKAMLTLLLLSIILQNAKAQEPLKTVVIKPDSVFHNQTKQTYFAVPRERLEEAYTRLKLGKDTEVKLKQETRANGILKAGLAISFVTGLVLGFLIGH